VESTNAGGEDRAESACVDTDGVNAADVIEGLASRSERKLLDAVGAARLLRTIEVRGGVPIFEHDGPAPGRGRAVQTGPKIFGPDAGRSNDTQASDGDPTVACHQSLPVRRS
jgi:hypothetical protein